MFLLQLSLFAQYNYDDDPLRASPGTNTAPSPQWAGFPSWHTALLSVRRKQAGPKRNDRLIDAMSRRAMVHGRTSTFEKISTEAQSQYLLDGHPVFGAPYPRLQRKSQDLSRTVIAEDTQSTVRTRRNPNAPVLVKVARFEFENSAKVLDDIALAILTRAEEGIASHFAIEIRHDKLKDGKRCTLTRRVNGSTLAEYFKNPVLAKSMSIDTLKGKMEDLRTAVTWLNTQGFEHRDIHEGNVMIDIDNDKLVLIDFGMAQKVHAGHSAADDFEPLLDFLNRNISESGKTYRRLFAGTRGPG